MKVALVHDWLTGMRGGERCLQAFLAIYPGADIFTLVHVPGSVSEEVDRRVKKVSFLNRLPGVRHYYRSLLPLFPFATRSFNFEGYGLVISLSHAAAKNVRVPEGIPHICYCFTPMRYIWDQAAQYLGKRRWLFWPLISALRRWDVRGSKGVTQFVAISQFVAARIRCFYHRSAVVIFPPVDTGWIHDRPVVADVRRRGAAFLYAGALVPYKRPEVVIEAFNKLGLELWVVGTGSMEQALKKEAASNIVFFGHLSDAELAECFARCRALVFPGTEDFGMIPVECMAAGRPVIGINHGGLKESLAGIRHWDSAGESQEIAHASGVFVRRSRKSLVQELLRAVTYFVEHEGEFVPEACQAQAKHFSPSEFFQRWNMLATKLGINPGHSAKLAGKIASKFGAQGSERRD